MSDKSHNSKIISFDSDAFDKFMIQIVKERLLTPTMGRILGELMEHGGAALDRPIYADTVLPEVGSIWHWEPCRPSASCYVEVAEVKWMDGEHWVGVHLVKPGPEFEGPFDSSRRIWNELSRWIEAAVLDTPASERED